MLRGSALAACAFAFLLLTQCSAAESENDVLHRSLSDDAGGGASVTGPGVGSDEEDPSSGSVTDGGGSNGNGNGGGGGNEDGGASFPPNEPTGVACAAGCAPGAMCDTRVGKCICVPGFVLQGSTCQRPLRSDPALRKQADVCKAWKEGHRQTLPSPPAYVRPANAATCEPGTLKYDALEDGVRRWNMYRWLVGLAPASVNVSNAQGMQECALILKYAPRHDPPPTATCYTAAGADMAAKSMISYRDTTGATDQWMLESYAMDNRLSHRKIMIATSRDNINYGSSVGGTCGFYGHGFTEPNPPPFLSVPNPGFSPVEMARSTWSIHMTTTSLALENMKVHDDTANKDVTMKQNLKYAGINGSDPLQSEILAGHTYTVKLGTVKFTTTLVNCP